jgi:sugar phosphate isomerase/epimerase
MFFVHDETASWRRGEGGDEKPIMTVIHTNVPYPMLLQRIDFAIQNQIHPEIYFSGEDLDACHAEDLQRLSRTLRENQLEVSIHGPFMDLSPGGVDQRIKEVTRERLFKTIQLAHFFNPRMIVFHPGYESWKFDGNINLWLESSLQTWKPLVKEAEEKGLTLAVENVFEEGPEPIKNLLEEIHSPRFRFCFDTGHQNVFARTSLPVWMEALGGFLSEVHLHDNHGEMDEHLPVGEGKFDFDQFFTLLSQSNRIPLYTIEPHEEAHLRRGLKAVKKYI